MPRQSLAALGTRKMVMPVILAALVAEVLVEGLLVRALAVLAHPAKETEAVMEQITLTLAVAAEVLAQQAEMLPAQQTVLAV